MPEDQDALRITFVARLFMARNRYRLVMDEHFKPLGITDATWRTLFYLEQSGDGVLQKALAQIMGIESPGLVRLLDQLEKRGLVERRPAKEDRRGKTVHLTPQANELLTELHRGTTGVRDGLLDGITPEDLQTCLRVLDQIITACNRADAK